MIGTCCHEMKKVAWCIDWKDGIIRESMVVCSKCYHDYYRGRKNLLSSHRWNVQIEKVTKNNGHH
jgi:hypothetical protein